MGFPFTKALGKKPLGAAPFLPRPFEKRHAISGNMVKPDCSFALFPAGWRRHGFFAAQALSNSHVNRIGGVRQRLFLILAIGRNFREIAASRQKAAILIFFKKDRIGENHEIGHERSLLKFFFGDIQIAKHLGQKAFTNLATLHRRGSSIEANKLVAAFATLRRNFKRQAVRTRISSRLPDEFFSVHSTSLKVNSAHCEKTQYCAHKFVHQFEAGPSI